MGNNLGITAKKNLKWLFSCNLIFCCLFSDHTVWNPWSRLNWLNSITLNIYYKKEQQLVWQDRQRLELVIIIFLVKRRKKTFYFNSKGVLIFIIVKKYKYKRYTQKDFDKYIKLDKDWSFKIKINIVLYINFYFRKISSTSSRAVP